MLERSYDGCFSPGSFLVPESPTHLELFCVEFEHGSYGPMLAFSHRKYINDIHVR